LLVDTSNLNRELAAFDAEVDRFESDYDTKADGKAGIQKGLDSVRSLFNRGADGKGYGDDQWKNIANTQHGLDQLKADVQCGRLDGQQAQHALAQLRDSFHGEADRVEQAQAGNARVGQAVHGAGRVAAVGAAGIARTVAGGGVNVVAGAAAAVAAGSAYDALTVGAGAADKKLGNGGNTTIAPSLDTNQSVGGLAAGALAGQKVEAKDVVHAGVGTTLDAVSGGFAGQGVKAARVSIATAQGSKQVAQAAAKASIKTGLQQSAATLGVQTAGTAIDPSLSAGQKRNRIVQQGKDTLTQLPGQLVFGAASSATGAVVKPANKLLDGVAQVGIDAASNLGEASTGNVLAGKGPALSAEQLAQAAVTSPSGAMHNVLQRSPRDGTGFEPVSNQELRELHRLPTADLSPLLGSHKKDSLAQTMRAGGIDNTMRPIEEPLGSIVLQSRGPADPLDDGFGAAPIDERSPPPRKRQHITGSAADGFGAAPIDEHSPPPSERRKAGWSNVTANATATSSQDVPSFDQLEHGDLQLGLGPQLREFHRDWKLLPEIASLSYQQHVAQPVKSLVNDVLIEPVAQSALGQAVGRQRDRVKSGVNQAKTLFDQSAPGRFYKHTFGRAFNSLDRYVVRNPAVWKGVDGVAKQMSNAIKIGGVATLAANRIVAGNGTLITGTAVSGDPNAPREAIEAANAGNLPKGMTFHYQYAPLPGVPTARAITTVGAKDGVFVPPATGAGQVGTASPWIGFKPNGANPGSKEMVGTASALAALGDVEASYNIGSTNFNLGLKAFGLAGRVGANIPRFEARNAPVPGAQNRFDVRALLLFDPLHVGATGTVNLGPVAITVERPRIPMTVKGAIGSSNADNWFDPFAPGAISNRKPVFSPVSNTYDPKAEDMQAIQQLLDQAAAVRLGVPQFEPTPEVQGPNFRGLELEEVKQVIDGREQTVAIVGTGPVELDPNGDIVSARGKRYELLEPDGSPITDLGRARERAQELIHWKAATDLTYDQADKLKADREAFTDELNELINRLPKDTRFDAADDASIEQRRGDTDPR
jgi:hypothetical protein